MKSNKNTKSTHSNRDNVTWELWSKVALLKINQVEHTNIYYDQNNKNQMHTMILESNKSKPHYKGKSSRFIKYFTNKTISK